MTVHVLDRAQARRLAVHAQLLSADRPTDLVATVEHLTLLQIDPTAAVAPSADLVAWSRLGSSYQPEQLRAALEQHRTLYELDAMVRPMCDLGLYLADMAEWPRYERARTWLEANDRFRRDVLDLLGSSGPLLSRDIPDSCVQPWSSTGWTHDRNVTQMLEFLMMRGEVAISGRRGRQRVWDLAERVYPDDVTAVPSDEARRQRDARRLRALGVAREATRTVPGEPYAVGEAGEPATIDGVSGTWRVDPELLDRSFEGRTALLSPFDRLVHDRTRALELFDFEYVLEMYKPKAKRRWGYFAMPVLHADRLVGKLDARADRRRGVFEVHAVHKDVPFDAATTDAVRAEIERLAAWLELELVGI
ncbi:MAG TPA: crosslink repair DNA glycosylase YcaQ family protein [Euzebyales bacterium]